jgi:hypothetical protein
MHTRGFSRLSTLAPVFVLAACTHANPSASSPATASSPKASGYDLVMQATSCWMGGLWSDAVGESGSERYAGIERRCDALLRDVDLTSREKSRALADQAPPPAAEEAYYPLRAVEPHVVDALAKEVKARADRIPAEAPYSGQLVTLLRSVADAARETIHARRAADVVKEDVTGQPSVEARTADKIAAGAQLRSGAALDALLHVDAGLFTDEAHAIGVLSALDRMEIARSLPKHLKVYTVATGYSDLFGVPPPTVPENASTPIKTGTWLAYLTDVAAAAGHPVPNDARDPQNREPLAWTGVLAGFADKLRADASRFPKGTPIGDVERGATARLDDEFQRERQRYEAHAPADR